MIKMSFYATEVPCKDCKDRKVGCHDGCVFYKQFKAACAEERAQRQMANMKYEYGKPLPRRK